MLRKVNVAPGFFRPSRISMLLASGVASGIIKYPNMATNAVRIINARPAMAERLRLKDFQVRWDGVSIILLMSRILLRCGEWKFVEGWCGENNDYKMNERLD